MAAESQGPLPPGRGHRSGPGGGGLRAAAAVLGRSREPRGLRELCFRRAVGGADLGLLNPSRLGPAGMGDGARELGREGGRALPRLRGAARDRARGFEDTEPCQSVYGRSDLY